MPGISRKTTDIAGGILIGGSVNVFANSKGVVRHGDAVQPHDDGIHRANPTMVAGSRRVFVNSIAVVNQGDLATCGHAISGSTNVFVGD